MPEGVLQQALVLLVAGNIAALVGVALLRRPQRGVLALAAMAPFSGLLLLIPHPPLLDGWKEALVLSTLAASLVRPHRASAQLRRPPWAAALVALVAVAVLSAVWVGGTQAVLGLKINFFYVLLVPALLRCPLTPGDRDRLVSILMTTGVLTAVVGLVQQYVGGDALAELGYEYNSTIRTAGGLLRSFSTFNQPFPFGLYVMLVLLVAAPVALSHLGRRRNQLFLLSTPVLLAGMLSSIVRAAILGLLVGGVFLWWHRYRHLAHAVPVALVCLLLIPASIAAPLLSSSSLGQRSEGWTSTVDEVLSAPLGNGVGATGSAAEKTARVTGSQEETYQPDNYYFKTLYELGPVGLWLLVLVLVASYQQALATSIALGAARPPPGSTGYRDRALAAGIASGILAAAAASFVATYFEIFPLDLFFWLFLGVLPSLRPGSPSTHSPSGQEEAASRPTSVSSPAP